LPYWYDLITFQIITNFHIPCLLCAANGGIKGSLTGISIGVVTPMDKVWRSLQAFGDIAFAYSYSLILIEIQVSILQSAM
jgi:Transmembrane amino acid transporter protein